MKIERKKNASRNIFYGLILKLYNILLPFFMRSIIIHYLGVEYLGLSSLFTSILHVLNLAELGVGSAMVFSMYEPIAHDDKETVCALMVLYRRYYRIIGLIVLICGTILLPFIPRLIHGNVPADINVYILFVLNLLATVFSYWLFAYRNSILNAHQRNDIISKISLFTNTLKYGIQIVVLIFLRNYYWYVITIIATQIINNVVTAVVSKRVYPEYKPEGELDATEIKKITNRIRDVFTAKLGGTILNSADTIVISAFLGLKLLAIYQNYYYIMSAIIGIFTIMFVSLTAGIGNSLVLESKEKNYNDYKALSFITFSLISFCCASMMTIYQPLIVIWVGKDLLLETPLVALICVYFAVVEYVQLASVYKDAAGIWHEDRFRPLVSGIVNLCLNLLMVNIWGLYGIVLSTIISAGLISAPWITKNLFQYVFEGKLKDYTMLLLKGLAAVLLSTALSYYISSYIFFSGIIELVIKIIVCVAVSSIVCITIFGRSKEFSRSKKMILSIVQRSS